MSLPKNERLKYNGLFLHAYQKGRFKKTKHLKVFYTNTLEAYKESLPFVGFVVPKKLFVKAVDRNKIKRRLKEIYRLYRCELLKQNKIKVLEKLGLVVIKLNYSPFNTKKDKKIKNYFSYDLLESELLELLNQILKINI